MPVLRLIPTSRHAPALLTPCAISCRYRCCFSASTPPARRRLSCIATSKTALVLQRQLASAPLLCPKAPGHAPSVRDQHVHGRVFRHPVVRLTTYASTVPSTVASLLAAVGLEPTGCVPWGTPVRETSTGVYVVALSPSADAIDCAYPEAPMSDAALDELCTVCPALTLDGTHHPARDQLAERIGSYWLSDETVLYVGLAGQPLRTRVRQYYKTSLGAAKPHKGGWWLKTLSVLADLHVHCAATADFKDAEENMLRTFAANVSDDSRNRLPADEPVMPFANLRDGDWRRRNHGIAGATTDTAAKPTPPARLEPVPPAPSPPPRTMSAPPTTTPQHSSQNLTATDIEVGQVRIPRGATKTVLPSERTDIAVVLRRRELGACRVGPALRAAGAVRRDPRREGGCPGAARRWRRARRYRRSRRRRPARLNPEEQSEPLRTPGRRVSRAGNSGGSRPTSLATAPGCTGRARDFSPGHDRPRPASPPTAPSIGATA